MEAELEVEADRRNANRRREHRYRCFKTARIVFNAGFTVFDCTVRNVSRGGALLEMETLLGIPKRFELALQYGETPRPVEVRWRTDRQMGIEFADMAKAA
jgi:hypothetical protein